MTTENNKLIAEFMGYENIAREGKHPIYKIPSLSYEEPNFDYGIMEKVETFTPYFDEMKFHSDWNWLMEVVEKIESLETLSYFNIQHNRVEIGTTCDCFRTKEVITKDVFSKIEAVYNACIEFIKWYSKQPK